MEPTVTTVSPRSYPKSDCAPEEIGSFKIVKTERPTSSNTTSNSSDNKITSEYKIAHYEARQTNRHKTPSGVWKYFALANKTKANPNEAPDDRILCMLCFDKGRVHVYRSKTSSSNLWKHLHRKHNIQIPSAEKMFTISTARIFEFGEEEGNSNDNESLVLDAADSGEMTMHAEDFQAIEGYKEEPEAVDDANFKDIGSAIIEAVAKRPILYDVHSYKSTQIRNVKQLLWTEVYEELGETIEISRIQKIWKNIRDRYRKIRLTEMHEQDSGSKRYKYYDQLSFLDAAVIDQSPETSLDEPPEKKVRTDDFSFLIEQTDEVMSTMDDLDATHEHYITEEIINGGNCTVTSSKASMEEAPLYPDEINQNTTDSPGTSLATSAGNSTEQMDEFDLFGKFIANKLRNAPKDRVNMLEVKIMQTILENC